MWRWIIDALIQLRQFLVMVKIHAKSTNLSFFTPVHGCDFIANIVVTLLQGGGVGGLFCTPCNKILLEQV